MTVMTEVRMQAVRARPFKNQRQAAVYDLYLDNPPAQLSGVLGEAYRRGLSGGRAMWPRTSMAFAAWMAGRDKHRSALAKVEQPQ